ncbi:LysR family transcriptional regulator [Burkholderia sp. MR1-5-21]
MDYFAAIRAFLHAADLGSFSQAAERIDVKTSTVSRYITELERDLGIALFNRSTRGLVLTEGGRVFRERALAAVQTLDDAREAAASLNASPKGLLRVTVPASFGRRHVVRHLPAFLARYPEIDVDVVVTDDVLNVIDAGIDVAIRIGVLHDSQLMARQLAVHCRVVVASPAYVEQHGSPATPDDLAQHATLRFSLASDDKWYFVRRNTHGTHDLHGTPGAPIESAVRLHGRVRIDDTDALLDLAIAGQGIALLPTWAVADAIRDGRLLHLLPDWAVQPSRTAPAIWAVYAPKKTVSSKVRAFIDFYAAVFADERDWLD